MTKASKKTGRIESREAAEAAFGLSVVAEIPMPRHDTEATPEVEVTRDPESEPSRAYRRLAGKVANLFGQGTREPGGGPATPPGFSVMVTSARDDETARSIVAVNLAAALAAAGHRALVAIPRGVDAVPVTNGSNPAAPAPGEPTLSPGEIIAHARPSWVTGVSSLALGELFPTSEGLLANFDALVGAAREVVDELVLETPLDARRTARPLLAAVDLVLVVCEYGTTTPEDGMESRRLLSQNTASPELGLVLAGTPAG